MIEKLPQREEKVGNLRNRKNEFDIESEIGNENMNFDLFNMTLHSSLILLIRLKSWWQFFFTLFLPANVAEEYLSTILRVESSSLLVFFCCRCAAHTKTNFLKNQIERNQFNRIFQISSFAFVFSLSIGRKTFARFRIDEISTEPTTHLLPHLSSTYTRDFRYENPHNSSLFKQKVEGKALQTFPSSILSLLRLLRQWARSKENIEYWFVERRRENASSMMYETNSDKTNNIDIWANIFYSTRFGCDSPYVSLSVSLMVEYCLFVCTLQAALPTRPDSSRE